MPFSTNTTPIKPYQQNVRYLINFCLAIIIYSFFLPKETVSGCHSHIDDQSSYRGRELLAKSTACFFVLLLLAAEGHALQGPGPVGTPGIHKGAHIVLPGAGGGVCRGLRPVGQVCVVGFHGGPGLDLCRQVKQIVRELQVVVLGSF